MEHCVWTRIFHPLIAMLYRLSHDYVDEKEQQ